MFAHKGTFGLDTFIFPSYLLSMETKVGVLSAGAWGTAISKVLAEKGLKVTLWDYMKNVVEEINNLHTNGRYLLGVNLPPGIKATEEIEEAADSDFLLITSPSLYLLDTIKKLLKNPRIQEGAVPIGVLTKGFLPTKKGPRLLLEALEEILPETYKDSLVYISGPSHAEEVARGKLTGLIAASKSGRNSIRFRELLTGKTLLVFSSFDTIGVQTAAAYKNVIAIAFGMLDALGEFTDAVGDNTESLLLAAGLNEIQTLGMALGSSYPETFTSIAGVGDLDVTCRSIYGRNRKFGREIITDRALDRYKNITDLISHIANIGYLPEGVMAAKAAWEISRKVNVKLPIGSTVYRILNRETEPMMTIPVILADLAKLHPSSKLNGGGSNSL